MPRKKSLKTQFLKSAKKTAHYDEYQVNNSSNDVFMSLYPGDTGQSATTDIILEGADADRNITDTIENYRLGNNKDLNGRYLEVYTVVTDVSEDSNLTSFNFRLKGGLKDYSYKMEKTVQSHGESVIYKITIFFYQ